MDEENNDERSEYKNMSADRFGHRLECPMCQGHDVEIQQMLWRFGDQNVRGLPAKDCGYWLEFDCRDCDYYVGLELK